MDTVTEK
jgi:hypothetical protein